jgi:hypothetical protein
MTGRRKPPRLMRRRIRDEADARKCLAAVERARVDGAEWAHAHGVDARSLNAWKLNLGRRGTKRVRLVELVPAQAHAPPRGRYALEVAGARLEFDDDFAAETLQRVVQALRSC